MRPSAPAAGRDPGDVHTIDLEAWLGELRQRRADRLRARHPDLPMVQLPLTLHERRRAHGLGGVG